MQNVKYTQVRNLAIRILAFVFLVPCDITVNYSTLTLHECSFLQIISIKTIQNNESIVSVSFIYRTSDME